MVEYKIGETKKGMELGYKNSTCKYTWCACEGCGKERWVQLKKDIPVSRFCLSCGTRGERNSNWKGGRIHDGRHYISIKLQPDDFFFPMTSSHGYVMEHRLTVAKALGRCLLKIEQVHHRNGVKDDNRYPENLELMPDITDHNKFGACSKCELRKEIRLLRLQMRNLQEALQGKLHV